MGVRLDLPNVELVDQHTALIKELETRQRIFIRELPAKLSEDMTWGFAKANLAPASLILASSGWLCPEFMAGAGDVANAAGNDADDDDQVPMDVGLAGYDVVDEGEAKARAKLAEEYVATTLGRRRWPSLLPKEIDRPGQENLELSALLVQLFGAYVYYDKERGVWIRTGKAENMKKRHQEHSDEATKKLGKGSFKTNNRFYLKYSFGLWQKIEGRVAVGWEEKDHAEVVSLFYWSPAILAKLKRSTVYGEGEEHLLKRQVAMVAYLFEHVLDLALDESNRISDNPGFEAFLQLFV